MHIRSLAVILLIATIHPALAEPRDVSEFTHLDENGFPLNVDPKIVSASEGHLE